jgi:hypothetical protein
VINKKVRILITRGEVRIANDPRSQRLTIPPLWPLQDRSLAFIVFANEERSVSLSPPQNPGFPSRLMGSANFLWSRLAGTGHAAICAAAY